MRLVLKGKELSLDSTKIMGILDIHADETNSIDDFVARALEMQEHGAELLEIGLNCSAGVHTEDCELTTLIPIVKAVCLRTNLYVAITTSYPKVMQEAVNAGAALIIDRKAFKEEGALEMAKALNVPICLVFDPNYEFSSLNNDDPMAVVSEFFYERIDACLNMKIPRSKIMIDPSIGIDTPIEFRLKMMGRLNTFKSFALPITLSVPRQILFDEQFASKNLAIAVAATLFMLQSGVHIIRTRMVEELTLGIDTWQALNESNRPFKLTKAIAKRFLRKGHN